MGQPLNNAIIVSDTHCGCQLGLCPPEVKLDNGGTYQASKFQKEIWGCWESFWGKWVPMVTRGEPFCVILNGDAMDGRHHGATTQISHNLADQQKIAYEVLAPVAKQCEGRFYFVRGTAVHTGESGENEERLAERLGSIPDESGNHSRFELYITIGGALVHLSHHIGTTSSMAFETTALMKEFTEFCANSARWKQPSPDIIVRSHRHRHTEIRLPTVDTYGYIFTTAGWQLKTPFLYRMPGGRVTQPMIGGSLIRQGDEEFFTRHKTWETKRPETETPQIQGG